MMKNKAPGILALGVGNILLSDEGVGVRAVEELERRFSIPGELEVIDGGTMGLDLLPYLQAKKALIIIDALKGGGKPGDTYRLEGDGVSAMITPKISPHQTGLSDLLAISTLQGVTPEKVVLLGVEPAYVGMGLELSPEVKPALEGLLKMLVREIRSLGIKLLEKN